ncbi:MAG: hemolysin family protein [Syntrophales bacterium]|nr:hemolysin family protein [Syntrophales bacterium]MDY0043845.1 hemolysin family protein [Syntrophales bacterium]
MTSSKKKGQSFLEEEIRSLIDIGGDEGLIDQQSGEMIQSILELGETVAREVMVPRTEIIAISISSAIDEILDLLMKHGHTRMPVYSDSIDNIIGVLNVKDLLRFWSKPIAGKDITSILRKAYFIPETKSIHFLLHELKEMKSHMAIVIDEYGGTSGLVTLEDLIEEIVGEIHDEHDIEEDDFIKFSNGDTLVDGRAEIEEFEKYFETEVPEGQFETVGGLIFYLIKKIPATGEVILFNDFEMIIESADERSIKKVRVRKKGEGEAAIDTQKLQHSNKDLFS